MEPDDPLLVDPELPSSWLLLSPPSIINVPAGAARLAGWFLDDIVDFYCVGNGGGRSEYRGSRSIGRRLRSSSIEGSDAQRRWRARVVYGIRRSVRDEPCIKLDRLDRVYGKFPIG